MFGLYELIALMFCMDAFTMTMVMPCFQNYNSADGYSYYYVPGRVWSVVLGRVGRVGSGWVGPVRISRVGLSRVGWVGYEFCYLRMVRYNQQKKYPPQQAFSHSVLVMLVVMVMIVVLMVLV